MTFVSCDEHEHIDLDIHPGHILLKSGRVISSADYFANGDSTAIGIVFSEEINESHYLVVSLDELSPLQFCDSLGGMNQGTSCDRTALDGMANTYALQGSMDTKTFHGSPLANAVASSHAPTSNATVAPELLRDILCKLANVIIGIVPLEAHAP